MCKAGLARPSASAPADGVAFGRIQAKKQSSWLPDCLQTNLRGRAGKACSNSSPSRHTHVEGLRGMISYLYLPAVRQWPNAQKRGQDQTAANQPYNLRDADMQ